MEDLLSCPVGAMVCRVQGGRRKQILRVVVSACVLRCAFGVDGLVWVRVDASA